MKKRNWSVLVVVALAVMLISLGCKKDPQKAPADKKSPTENAGKVMEQMKEGAGEVAGEVKEKVEEAKDMAADKLEELKKQAQAQKEKFASLGEQMAKVQEEIKTLKPTEMMGEKATEYKDKLSKLMMEQADVKKAFDAVVEKIKELGGDVSGLNLN